MPRTVNVIDLFAGPGGLAEGFAGFRNKVGHRPFKVMMSIEKEPSAHRTLELRAFYRSFNGRAPDAYYDYVRGTIGRDELFSRYPSHAMQARAETLNRPRELGNDADDRCIHGAIRKILRRTTGDTVLVGGPPCQAYSIVGRSRSRGIPDYRPEKDRRHFLYREYLKTLVVARPAVFVMENVKGILSSHVNGSHIFPRILDDLSDPASALRKRTGPRYRIYSFVERPLCPDDPIHGNYLIESEYYGIPQTRHRVILLGVREDVSGNPTILRRRQEVISVANAIGDLPAIRSGVTHLDDTAEVWHETVCSIAKLVSRELNAAGLSGKMAKDAARAAGRIRSRGGPFVAKRQKLTKKRQLHDSSIGGYLNHESRLHMPRDLARYLYCACFAKQNDGISPKAHEIPSSLAPKHKNWKSGHFRDRFTVQTADFPSRTITSHIAKDGHYFIHYDPAQCRSLTVREAARLQTFPDNYFFEGNRTEQYVQVGNAVPPLLAGQIAGVVWRLLS